MLILIPENEISKSATSDWWEKQSEAFKNRYLERHPKSKFGEAAETTESPVAADAVPELAKEDVPVKKKRRKKRKARAKAQSKVREAMAKPKEALEADLEEAVKREPSAELTDEEAADIAADIDKDLEENPEASDAEKDLDLSDDDYDDPAKVEKAKIAAYVLTVLVAASLIAMFPENTDSIAMLATQAGKSWIELIEERASQKENEAKRPKIKVPLRAEEKANEEARRHDLREVQLDSNGNFKDEVEKEVDSEPELTTKPNVGKMLGDALVKSFVKKQKEKKDV